MQFVRLLRCERCDALAHFIISFVFLLRWCLSDLKSASELKRSMQSLVMAPAQTGLNNWTSLFPLWFVEHTFRLRELHRQMQLMHYQWSRLLHSCSWSPAVLGSAHLKAFANSDYAFWLSKVQKKGTNSDIIIESLYFAVSTYFITIYWSKKTQSLVSNLFC